MVSIALPLLVEVGEVAGMAYKDVDILPIYLTIIPLGKGFSSASLPQSFSTKIWAILGKND